jgi:abhydrolase domain-containing protein 12
MKDAPPSRVLVCRDASVQTDVAGLPCVAKRSSSTNVLLAIGVAYALICISFLSSPFLQSIPVYMNIARWPLGDLTQLQRFGLVGSNNVAIQVQPGQFIRGYHVLPGTVTDVSRLLSLSGAARDEAFQNFLRKSDRIVIYLHGNAGTRAHYRRVALQKHLALHCNAHVLTFDYRGFGDSDGWPSEEGTTEDVHAMVSWLKTLSIPNHTKIILYGESLGSGIAVSYLHAHPEEMYPSGSIQALILMAPFTSLPEAALSHPIAAPFRVFRLVKEFM